MTSAQDTGQPLADETHVALDHALDQNLLLAVTVDGARLDDPQAIWDDLDVWAIPLLGGNLPKAQTDNGPWLLLPTLAPSTVAPAPIDPDADPDEAAAEMVEAMRRALDAGDETGGGQLGLPDATPRSLREARLVLTRFLENHVSSSPVIWALPEGTDRQAFRRHLRRLNRVRLARRPRPRHPVVSGTDEVNFRHADGTVLTALQPLLRPEQVAHILGPAVGPLAIAALDAPGVRKGLCQIVRPAPPTDDNLSEASDVLTLDAAQVDALEDVRAAPLDKRIADILVMKDGHAADLAPEARLARVSELRRTVYDRTTFRADAHVCDLVDVMWRRCWHGPAGPRSASAHTCARGCCPWKRGPPDAARCPVEHPGRQPRRRNLSGRLRGGDGTGPGRSGSDQADPRSGRQERGHHASL